MPKRPPRRQVRIGDIDYGYSITQEQLTRAIEKVDRLTLLERLKRIDDVNISQPALFSLAFDVMRFGVNAKTTDHAIQVMLVMFECSLELAPTFPTISRAAVERALNEQKARAVMRDHPPHDLPEPLAHPWASRHAEHFVVSYVVEHLSRNVPDPTWEHHFVIVVSIAIMNAYLDALAEFELDEPPAAP